MSVNIVRSYFFKGRDSRTIAKSGGQSVVVLSVGASISNSVTGVTLGGVSLTRSYISSVQYECVSVYHLNYFGSENATMVFSGSGSGLYNYIAILDTPVAYKRANHEYGRILEQDETLNVTTSISSTYTTSGDILLGMGHGTRGAPYWGGGSATVAGWTLRHKVNVDDGRVEAAAHTKASLGSTETYTARIAYGSLCVLIANFSPTTGGTDGGGRRGRLIIF